MALTTKSVNPLTHFNQDYYNNLKRNVSMKEAEAYRLRVTQQRPKAIDLWQPWAFKKVSENEIRGYKEQNEIAKQQQERLAEDERLGKVVNLGTVKNPEASTDPEADKKAQELAEAKKAEAEHRAKLTEAEANATVDNPVDLWAGEPVGDAQPDDKKDDDVQDPDGDDTVAISRDDVIQLLRDNGHKVPWNIGYETAIKKATEAWLL